jgi:glucose-6-phosphate isomerase
MTVTASRLGNSPLTMDWSGLAAVPAGTGTAARAAAPDREAFAEAWTQLKKRFDGGEVGFYHAPERDELSQAKASRELAARLLGAGKFKDCLFLGIGGSALGPISLLSALRDRANPGLRFHFMENPDPVEWRQTLASLSPASTLVCVAAKSGTTFETLAQFLLALEWLGKARWTSNVVAITDPKKGDLRAFADAEGIPTLSIDPSIGGRFSVFSPVGLFPLALAGLSLDDFLLGARQVREHVEKGPHEKSPLFVLAQEVLRHYAKRPIHVCMPYSTPLRLLGSWFVQLWAESLGKDGKGFTPISALGATDQHSILQLLRDGPDDKITFFVTVDQAGDPVAIPRRLPDTDLSRLPAFTLLQGHSLQELLDVEYRAISLVLTRRARPHLTFRLDRLDERGLGAAYFAFSVLTAVTGTLWGVNPFDQPGVEEGKVYIRESLSQGARRESD